MLITLIGPSGSDKHRIAAFLIENYGFKAIHLRLPKASDQSSTIDGGDVTELVQAMNRTKLAYNDEEDDNVFERIEDIAAWTTARHPKRFVFVWPPERTKESDFAVGGRCCLDRHGIFELRRRPFGLLVAVDAPLSARWARWKKEKGNVDGFEAFAREDERVMFGCGGGCIGGVDTEVSGAANAILPLYDLIKQADLTVTGINIPFASIHALGLVNPTLYRPDWDTYFMRLCDLAASRSNCVKRKVGCVVTRDCSVIATGYNGTPRGVRNCSDGGCKRCCGGQSRRGEALDVCWCLHAEENALLEAGRDRITSGGGKAILYCNTCPCIGCSKKIAQAGISEVVYLQSYGLMDVQSKALLEEAGVTLRQHVFSSFAGKVVHL